MPLSPEALYLQLGHLVAEMPDLANCAITPEVNQWLGRAAALVEATGDLADTVRLNVSAENLGDVLRVQNARTIVAIVHRALAKAELGAPAPSRGAFVAAGNSFDAFMAVGKVLETAKTDVLMVDPYADQKALSDFAVLAGDGVKVRLLADQADHKTSLKPAAARWVQQYGQVRPLEVRLAPSKTLHDRLIIVDSIAVWALGQSFNKLAERAHTSIVRSDPETAALKITAYAALWRAATPL